MRGVRPTETRAVERMDALEKAKGRRFTQADCDLALEKLETATAELTEPDFTVLGYFRAASTEAEARAAKEQAIHPPAPPAPAPPALPPPQQMQTVKRFIRDAQGGYVVEEQVPVNHAWAVVDHRRDLEQMIAKSRGEIVAAINVELAFLDQTLQASLRRLADVERSIAALEAKGIQR